MDPVPFHELATAVFCRRKLYYRRRTDEPPTSHRPVSAMRELAFAYSALIDASNRRLGALPIACGPDRYREQLRSTRDRLHWSGRWTALCDPDERDVYISGRRCRGIVHKVLSDPLEPSIVSAGRPPDSGVWPAEAIRAVAAATALAEARDGPIARAWLEYPAHGIVRRVDLTRQRRGRLHRVLHQVRPVDRCPPPTGDRQKCTSCAFAPRCGISSSDARATRQPPLPFARSG